MHVVFDLLVGILALAVPPSSQSLAARITASHYVADPMGFAIPSLRIEGFVRPAAGNRLYVVALALGEEPIDADVGRFVLVATDGTTYLPIGAGGRPDLIVPLDRIPIDREVGEILPSNAIISLVRRSATSVALEVGPRGTIAFLYELPAAASVRALRLPDGRELAAAPVP
jgi:hypothetical protein